MILCPLAPRGRSCEAKTVKPANCSAIDRCGIAPRGARQRWRRHAGTSQDRMSSCPHHGARPPLVRQPMRPGRTGRNAGAHAGNDVGPSPPWPPRARAAPRSGFPRRPHGMMDRVPCCRCSRLHGARDAGRCSRRSPWMGTAVHLEKPFAGHLRVHLCRRDRGVAEHLLDDPQIGAVLEHVRRARVTHDVR